MIECNHFSHGHLPTKKIWDTCAYCQSKISRSEAIPKDDAAKPESKGCSDCGGKVNPAQVKASIEGQEAFLRE